jgi:hypothetical protein
MPELTQLQILFCAPFNPPSQYKGIFKLHQLQGIKLEKVLQPEAERI